MKLIELLKYYNRKGLVEIYRDDHYISTLDYSNIANDLLNMYVKSFNTKLNDLDTDSLLVVYLTESNPDKDVNTFFYGIDFKKIELYCKVSIDGSIKTKEVYRSTKNILLHINLDKFYKVENINFVDHTLIITVDYTKYNYNFKLRDNIKTGEDRIRILLNFNMVDFSYFFEDVKQNDLEELDF